MEALPEIVECSHFRDDAADLTQAQGVLRDRFDPDGGIAFAMNLRKRSPTKTTRPKAPMKSDARQVLADFFIQDQSEWPSERAYCRAHELQAHDVRRARNGQTGISLDKLQDFAAKLGVAAWQLLYPGFRRNSQDFPSMSTEAIDLALTLDKITDRDRRKRVYASLVQTLSEIVDAQPRRADAGAPPPPSAESMRLHREDR